MSDFHYLHCGSVISDTQEFFNATPRCPNLSPLLPSFGQARVTCLPRHAAVAECQRDMGTGRVAPMASTWSSTQLDPPFDDPAAAVAKDQFTDVEEAVARLVHATYPPDARVRGPASDRSADARISQSFAATLGSADLRPPIPREHRSLSKRGPLAGVAIAVCLGTCAIWAWRSYGDPARSTPPPAQAASIAQAATTAANDPSAASAERQQAETSDLAALRQTVEQLAAGQEQLTREIAKLQTEKLQADKPLAEKPDKRMLGRVSADPAPPVAAPARKPTAITPMPPQAARRVSTVSPLSPPPQPAPQIRSETQPPNLAPLRPPMPVPKPELVLPAQN
jgi:hypothetical protein